MSEIKDFNLKIFADRLKELRTEAGIGQNKLAEILNLSNASISYWENCKQEPSASAIFKLAKYFNISSDYLLGISDWM